MGEAAGAFGALVGSGTGQALAAPVGPRVVAASAARLLRHASCVQQRPALVERASVDGDDPLVAVRRSSRSATVRRVGGAPRRAGCYASQPTDRLRLRRRATPGRLCAVRREGAELESEHITSKETTMADEALFIGWGDVVRGRERKAVDVFNESIEYYGQLQQDGQIERFDAWFLAPHGGDLAGFVLLHGEREQLDRVQRSPEFELLLSRAGLIVDRMGVVNAYTGEALGRLMGQFAQATAELAE
jgi:hypothetical protein